MDESLIRAKSYYHLQLYNHTPAIKVYYIHINSLSAYNQGLCVAIPLQTHNLWNVLKITSVKLSTKIYTMKAVTFLPVIARVKYVIKLLFYHQNV